MAPLKFRAWDKQKNVMLEKPIVDEERGSLDYTFTQLAINFDGLVLGFSSHDWGKDGIHEHDVNVKDRFILMQSTGLLDKNGKEIFEGDVVRYKELRGFACEDDDFRSSEHVEICIKAVRYSDGAFWPRPYFNDCEDGYYSWRRFDFEVIGNEHENPELLTPTPDARSDSL